MARQRRSRCDWNYSPVVPKEAQQMSQALIAKYTEERQTLSELITNTLGRADAENRDLVDSEIETLESSKTRMSEIDRQMSQIKDVLDTRDSGLDMSKFIHQADRAPITTQERQVPQDFAPSLGDFIGSEAYRSWDGHGSSGRFSLETRATQLRAPLSEGASPGSLLLPNNQKFVLPQGISETPLLDAVGRLNVSSNAIDLVTYGSPKGATGAAVVAELAAKPEASITASTTTVNVETIAYWIQASRQLLQDAPAARSLIDGQLRLGLKTKLETEVSTAIAGATYTKTTGASKQPLIEVARMAMATIQSAGFSPNALLCSPTDAANFDILMMNKTLLGAAYGVGVFGLQVIPVPGLTKAYLGDFKVGVQLLERTGVEVFITDSHTDTFTKNIFTILAELRAKAVVTQPLAITELVLTS
jgi:HK97 family phage major capsid protein